MKIICKLKINDGEDREQLVKILTFAGYKVSIVTKHPYYYSEVDYYVVVEKGEAEHGT
jgi:hypothetical protein